MLVGALEVGIFLPQASVAATMQAFKLRKNPREIKNLHVERAVELPHSIYTNSFFFSGSSAPKVAT